MGVTRVWRRRLGSGNPARGRRLCQRAGHRVRVCSAARKWQHGLLGQQLGGRRLLLGAADRGAGTLQLWRRVCRAGDCPPQDGACGQRAALGVWCKAGSSSWPDRAPPCPPQPSPPAPPPQPPSLVSWGRWWQRACSRRRVLGGRGWSCWAGPHAFAPPSETAVAAPAATQPTTHATSTAIGAAAPAVSEGCQWACQLRELFHSALGNSACLLTSPHHARLARAGRCCPLTRLLTRAAWTTGA